MVEFIIPLEWRSILLLICLALVTIFVFFWGRIGSSLSHYIRTAELRRIARRSFLPDDELLFREPPPKEDCPICFLPMPHSGTGIGGVHAIFQSCCGKTVCSGCMAAVRDDVEDKRKMNKRCCPFCRVESATSSEEHIKRTKLRMKAGDADAFHMLGQQYAIGGSGLPMDKDKAFELWTKAAELGSLSAHYMISFTLLSEEKESTYLNKEDEQKAVQKSIHHCETAAIGGHEVARNNLGAMEATMGNMDRAMKHFMISARAGFDLPLTQIRKGYKAGHVTKDEYAKTLREYQLSVDEMKSEQRTKDAASRRRKRH